MNVRETAPLPGKHIAFSRTRREPTHPTALGQRRIHNAGSDVALVDAWRMLRTQVLQRLQPRGWNSLAVVSCAAGDGRTTTAVNLGIAIAADPEHAALVVDLDLRTAGVAAALGLQPSPDIVDLLLGEASFEDVLLHPGIERMTILPARPFYGAAELLGSRQVEAQLAQMHGRYRDRVVIYDLPPLLTCAEGLTLLPAVDAVLVVVRDGATRRDDLLRLIELLGDKPVLGTVLNAAADRRVVERMPRSR